MAAALRAGEPVREVAERFGVGFANLWMHWERHEQREGSEWAAAAQPAEATLDAMAKLTEDALRLLAPWGLSPSALRILERRERQLHLASRLRSSENEPASLALAQSREWQELKAKILLTLERFPDAYEAMLEALGDPRPAE
ncbi:MAG: hypothetical protein R2762_18205 [Bryobacteraceae bacterium]